MPNLKLPEGASNIVVLTGAGISAESGLLTFRDNGGLWEGHRVEDVATPEAFARSPNTVQRFYNDRRRQLLNEAKPNAAHKALARFEKGFSGEFLLVTQNVDNLHEQAGSQNLLHIHGKLLSARCTECMATQEIYSDLSESIICNECRSLGSLRPDIVWFGEIPMHMQKIEHALSRCDVFISIGTSGQVYPAAGFVSLAKRMGAATFELNKESTENPDFDHHITGNATAMVKAFFEQ